MKADDVKPGAVLYASWGDIVVIIDVVTLYGQECVVWIDDAYTIGVLSVGDMYLGEWRLLSEEEHQRHEHEVNPLMTAADELRKRGAMNEHVE